ncbi:hypothetical protein AYO44_09985 [Planctomycetaceae bacterium SCGC AG-212-F19]|nr:hypothetical protein AYO44_09985 [Planctomycetaceae bacterium SCGC AG-212-F19]
MTAATLGFPPGWGRLGVEALREATLYRWDRTEGDSESPADEHNHALAALHYLVSRMDEPTLGRPSGVRQPAPKRQETPWLSLRNEPLWRRVWLARMSPEDRDVKFIAH